MDFIDRTGWDGGHGAMWVFYLILKCTKEKHLFNKFMGANVKKIEGVKKGSGQAGKGKEEANEWNWEAGKPWVFFAHTFTTTKFTTEKKN